MMFSKSCIYGIQSAIYLAGKSYGHLVPIRQISRELDMSFHYLTKILQRMARHGLIISMRGQKGGVKLARPADDITVKDLIEAFDGLVLFYSCVLGLPGCGTMAKCPLHDQWCCVREHLDDLFTGVSIHDLRNSPRLRHRIGVPEIGVSTDGTGKSAGSPGDGLPDDDTLTDTYSPPDKDPPPGDDCLPDNNPGND